MEAKKYSCYDALSFPIFVLNSSFEIVFWNKSIEGYSRLVSNEVIDRPVFDVYPNLNNFAFKERITSVLKSGLTDTFNPQLNKKLVPLQLKNGKFMVHKIVVSRSLVKEDDHLIFTIHDQSEIETKVVSYRKLRNDAENEIKKRKLSEKKLEEYLERLEESNEELMEFSQVISHDLRAPLRGIGNLITWIAEDSEKVLSGESKGHVEMVKKSVRKMEDMVEGLLSYAKLRSEKSNEVTIDLNQVVESISELYVSNTNIDITVLGNLPVLTINWYKIYQVFQNLIDNAIKHNPKDKTNITISCVDNASEFQFSVRDNGPGIKDSDYKRIFTIFKTLKMDSQSHGLGLAIVKKIITQYGGKIWVESVIGEGSEFVFCLPKKLG